MYYKKILHILFVSFFSSILFAQENIDTLFDKANKAFEIAQYQDALENYEKLLATDIASENLYYNIASCYYKLGQNGKSILYFEKALKQNPNNENILHNLKIVNQNLERPLKKLPDLFFIVWWKNFTKVFNSNTWALIAIVFAWLGFLAFAVYLFSKSIKIKKISFFKTIAFFFITFLSYFISLINAQKISKPTEIVLIAKEASTYTAPSINSKNELQFFEGAKLDVLDQVDSFYKVKSSEGDVVWLLKQDFEKI